MLYILSMWNESKAKKILQEVAGSITVHNFFDEFSCSIFISKYNTVLINV